MNYCDRCGTKLEPAARFCQECGYDTTTEPTSSETQNPVVDQPKVIYIAEPEPDPPVRKPKSASPQKGRKTWLWIGLVVIGVGALGAAGWFGYNKFFAPPKEKETPADTIANSLVPVIADVDTTARVSKVPEPPIPAATEPPKVKAKTPTKTVKKITAPKAKEQVKEQSKPAEQATTPIKQIKPDPVEKVSPNSTVNDSMVKVIFEVGRKEDPKNKNPKNPTKMVIRKPTMIVRITTDHYNDGNGTSAAGNLSIKDREGNVIGTFSAIGKSGTIGTPNAKWVAEPRIVLEKGTYFIWDSDISTWSKNILGIGMVVVEGYEIK